MLSPAISVLHVKSLHSKCGEHTHAHSRVHTICPPSPASRIPTRFPLLSWEHGHDRIQESCLPPPQGVGRLTRSGRFNHSPEQKRGQSSCRRDIPLCHPLLLDSPGLPWTESISRSTKVPSRGWSESQLSQRKDSLLLWDSATAAFFDAKWFSSSPRVNICLMQSFLSQFRPPVNAA